MKQKRKHQGTKYEGFKANLKSVADGALSALLFIISLTWLIATPAISVQGYKDTAECHVLESAVVFLMVGVWVIFIGVLCVTHECCKWPNEDWVKVITGFGCGYVVVSLFVHIGLNFRTIWGHYWALGMSILSTVLGILQAAR